MFSERSEDFPPRSNRSSAGIETGTKLYISNLDYGVMNEDVKVTNLFFFDFFETLPH